MSKIDKEKQPDENALAYAAIGLFGNKTSGPEPQWHELAAWSSGTLTEPRSTQILSHVANNPDIFQQWLDVAEAQAWVDEEALTAVPAQEHTLSTANPVAENPSANTPSAREIPKLNTRPTSSLLSRAVEAAKGVFQQPLPVYGGAFAAIMLAVLLAPLLQTGGGLTLQQQLDRSMDTYIDSGQGLIGSPPFSPNTRSLGGLFDDMTVAEVERAHFQTGLYQFNEKLKTNNKTQALINEDWSTWLAQLPSSSVDCGNAIDTEHCTRVAQNLTLLGNWSLMNTTACQALTNQNSPILASTFWSDQYPLYEQIRQLPEVVESQVFSSLITQQSTPSAESICAVAQSVLAAGYRETN